MKNLNFWSKSFILNFWSSWCSRLLRPCTKWRGQKKLKSMSFHQYSWNSEVETTWISLIGWHHKTSSKHLSLVNKIGDKTVHCISKVLSDETVFVDDNLWFVIISNDILFEKLLIESHARLIQGNLVHWFVVRLSSGGLSRGCCWGQSKSKDRQPKAKTDLTLVVLCCVHCSRIL